MYIFNIMKCGFDFLCFFCWCNYWDYGMGMLGDLFVYLFFSFYFIISFFGLECIVAMGGL